MMEFRPVASSAAAIAQYEQLLATCFPGTTKFGAAYLTWLYDQNPDGKVVGFDAWHGEQLAAHYVTVPATARVGDAAVRVLLSLNTATHPDHRGQGLFTQLAERTYDAGKQQGFDAVYGVANANSTPGFLGKLRFQLIEPLLAKVGIGGLGVDFAALEQRTAFRRVWTRESLAWRCACPTNAIVARRCARGTQLRTRGATGTSAWTEIPERFDITTPRRATSPLRLFLGLLPRGVGGLKTYVDIPKRLRPSPLNLIYRSLSGRVERIDPGAVFLTFADFDAY